MWRAGVRRGGGCRGVGSLRPTCTPVKFIGALPCSALSRNACAARGWAQFLLFGE